MICENLSVPSIRVTNSCLGTGVSFHLLSLIPVLQREQELNKCVEMTNFNQTLSKSNVKDTDKCLLIMFQTL